MAETLRDKLSRLQQATPSLATTTAKPKPQSLSERIALANKQRSDIEAAKQAEIEDAKRREASVVGTLPNRIIALCDDSGSMAGRKNEMLRSALHGFLDAIDTGTTCVSIQTFNDSVSCPFTTVIAAAKVKADAIKTPGDTPMVGALTRVLDSYAMTRVIMVSDGAPTDNLDNSIYDIARTYAEAGVPVDTLFIADGESGYTNENAVTLMREVARITSGIFIHFTDVSAFAGALHYLVPEQRHLLLTEGAKLLTGANEVSVFGKEKP